MSTLEVVFPGELSPERINLGVLQPVSVLSEDLRIIELSKEMIGALDKLSGYIEKKIAPMPAVSIPNSYAYCIYNIKDSPRDSFLDSYGNIYAKAKELFEKRLDPLQRQLVNFKEDNQSALAIIERNVPNVDELLTQARADWLGWTVEKIHANRGVFYVISVIIQVFSRAFAEEVQYQTALCYLQGRSVNDIAIDCIGYSQGGYNRLQSFVRGLDANPRYAEVLTQLCTYGTESQVSLGLLREKRELEGRLDVEKQRAMKLAQEIALIKKNHRDRQLAFKKLLDDAEFRVLRGIHLRHKARGFKVFIGTDLSTERARKQFIGSQTNQPYQVGRNNPLTEDPGMTRGFDRSGRYFLLFRRDKGFNCGVTYEFYLENLNESRYDKMVFTEDEVRATIERRYYGRGPKGQEDDEYKVQEDVNTKLNENNLRFSIIT